nr:alanine racemase [Propionibacterium sp.]
MLYATTATTHLGNIRRNLAGIRARVTADRPDRLVLAAVKANAYGHGAREVALMIEATGSADWLGVATVPEAQELRAAGVTLPMLKLSPAVADDEVAGALVSDLTLAVATRADIERVAAAAAARGRPAAVHLKVDTGMRRVGCEPGDVPALCELIDRHESLRLEGLFSHLPISDCEAGRAFTERQIATFAAVARAAEEARGPIPLKHLANSGGVLMHPGSWFDMVRPGIMIYGNLPDPTTPPTVALRPGLTWTTVVSFVKRVPAGETVGYGRTWTAPADTWIATLPVGYGDGYSRLQSNNGRVLIGGRSYPIAGRVCMDQLMVDLGPGEPTVGVGDEAVLLGRSGDEEIPCAEIAERMRTITYEVTCLIGGRVVRAFDED